MEQSLTVWIEDMTKKRLPLDGNVVRQKALKILNCLKETGQPSTVEYSHQFVASKGWFEKFKRRHSLHSLKIQDERASADADAADKYSGEFAKIIKEHNYLPDQIFNADEAGHLKKFVNQHLTACWKALLPEAAVQETVANPMGDEYRYAVRLANLIRGDGFDEVTVDDIRDIVTDDEINEADLVALTNVALLIEDSSDDLSNAKIENFSLKSVEKILNLARQLEEYVL
uniref:HTH CENPB-type domain-containing protein n=1 Tax=Glossina austeni TaxID=7395 RepID=A0A1A9UNX9_GLOAU